ncbi:MAG: asparagine synthase (glutamine-hydrolyzing) [Gammaproteobacteria bacterium]|nr:asparagine synthase (glutamine-hydrolyzing) [Gammaproteobacteria bacterium]
MLVAYIHWGIDVLKKIEGMFAFAILDRIENKIIIARDFFGIKPLYYSIQEDKLFFASEIKTLLCFSSGKRSVNPQKIYDYLRYGLTDHGSETLFQGIYQLPPAHYMQIVLNDFTCTVKKYWSITTDQKCTLQKNDASEYLRTLFLDNIDKHLRSDVKVGAALSGGLDSSSIVMAIKTLRPDTELHTFSYVASGDDEINEEKWIDIVAKSANSKTHKTFASSKSLMDDMDNLILTQDEPFGSTSIYAQYQVFKLAKQMGIKVMLDGQGADEILGGYHTYLSTRAVSLFRQNHWLRLVKFLASGSKLPGMNLGVLAAGAADYLLSPKLQGIARKAINKELVPSWLNKEWILENNISMTMLRQGNKSKNTLTEELRRSVSEKGLSSLLRYEDRNSMAFSIESRVPFLTPKLVNFLFSLPEEMLIDDNAVTKAIFRDSMRGILPDAIANRKDKIGFKTPETGWLNEEKNFFKEIIYSANDIAPLNLNVGRIELDNLLDKNRKMNSYVWRMVNLVRWSQIFNVSY